MKLRAAGKRDASKIIQEILKSPNRATKYRKAYSNSFEKQREQLTPLSALAMFVEASLSRRQYEIIRWCNKAFYPCYTLLQNAKKECYPIPESYEVTSTCADLNLQNLLDHTVTRLLLYLQEVVVTLNEKDCRTLILTCKWGCDGSQQAQFKQKFQSDLDSDSNIFQSSFVPLRLSCGAYNEKIVWQNQTLSSPRYCWPIRISFIKESVDIINKEIQYIENKMMSLRNTEVTIAGKTFSIKYTMILTMIDAKVCNAATHTTSTMKCYICGAISKSFNDISEKKDVNPDTLKFGLSILHARIRLFESLLHLSYKLLSLIHTRCV